MEIAEAVLTLSYELEHSQTMVKAYQAKGDTLDENYVSLDQVWSRVSFSSGSGDSLSYSVNGVDYELKLSQLSKEIVFEDQASPKRITFVFSNDDVVLTKTVMVENNSYPLNVSWTLPPLKSQIYNASLYLTTLLDLKYHFEKADIPQYLDWVNPWDAPEPIKTSNDTTWAVASFAGVHLKDSYLGLYDDTNDVGFAFKFNDLPDWGNIGALGNRQIDAVRFVYNFSDAAVYQTVSCSYQILTLSKSSYPTLQPEGLKDLFNHQSEEFTVTSRDFSYYIEENDIGFIVYDRNQLDTQMIHSRLLQLIYSNDRYVIFQIIK
jgi:hypothetical protein